MVIPFVNKIERGKDWIAGISVTDANWNGNYVEITFSLKFSYEVAKRLIHLPGQQGFSIPIDSNKWSQVSEVDSKFQNIFITIFPKFNAIQLCLTYLWIHRKKRIQKIIVHLLPVGQLELSIASPVSQKILIQILNRS